MAVTRSSRLGGFVPAPSPGYKDFIDCSSNPNYPEANMGDMFLISKAGKIGGTEGTPVEIGAELLCVKNTVSGTQAEVGVNWKVL
jgi:hypothetical protein